LLQEPEVILASDERCGETLGLCPDRPLDSSRPPHGEGPRLALHPNRVQSLVLDGAPRGTEGDLPDNHGPHGRGLLEPGGGVHDVPGCHGLALLGPGLQGYDRLARIHADANGEVQSGRLLVQLGYSLEDPEPRSDRSFRVVFVGDRRTEEGHHRVAHELLDPASESFDLRSDLCVVRMQGGPDVLGIRSI
jgi:hypothetical protein